AMVISISPWHRPARGRRYLARLLGAKDDQAPGGVVGRDGDGDAVAEDDADAIPAHAPGELRQDAVTAGDLDAKVSARGNLDDVAFELYVVIPAHVGVPL